MNHEADPHSLAGFVATIEPHKLPKYRELASAALDAHDAALQEAELELKYGGDSVARPIPDLEFTVKLARYAVKHVECMLHAIQARIIALRLSGKDPQPPTFTAS
jgi:hypothetical protein